MTEIALILWCLAFVITINSYIAYKYDNDKPNSGAIFGLIAVITWIVFILKVIVEFWWK